MAAVRLIASSPHRLIASSLLALSLAIDCATEPARAASIAGVIRFEIPAGGRGFVSLPFALFDPAVTNALAGQLTPADQILTWDSGRQEYVRLSEVPGLTLAPGNGFWIENGYETARVFTFAGRILDEASVALNFKPALSAYGSPYFSSVSNLSLGVGAWTNNPGENTVIWTVTRPYAAYFAGDSNRVAITDIQMVSNACLLRVSAATNFDLFFRNLGPTNKLDDSGPWRAGLLGRGAGETTWRDADGSNAYARVYVTAPAGRLSLCDGKLIATEPFAEGSTNETPSFMTYEGSDLTNSAGPGGLAGSETNAPLMDAGPFRLSGVVVVDSRIGNDAFSGRSRAVSGTEGPKRTIAGGMREMRAGENLIIREGAYGEDLNVRAARGPVFIEGRVNLTGHRKIVAIPGGVSNGVDQTASGWGR